MATIDLPYDESGKKPGTWSWQLLVGTEVIWRVRVICPKGHRNLLTAEQLIDWKGAVGPPIACGAKGCSWTARVRLHGWRRGIP